MEQEGTTEQLVRLDGDRYVVSLAANAKALMLDKCWQRPATTVTLKDVDPLPQVRCSKMAYRAVRKMLHEEDSLEGGNEGNVKVKLLNSAAAAAASSYLVALAAFGPTAWKNPKCELSVAKEVVERARSETIEELRCEYASGRGEVNVTCQDGVLALHEGVLEHLKVPATPACSDSNNTVVRLPISRRQLAVIMDFVYLGQTSFDRAELAAVCAASCLTNFDMVWKLNDALRQLIRDDWSSALCSASLDHLNAISLALVCFSEDFVQGEHDRTELGARLLRWTEATADTAARRTVKDRMLALLDRHGVRSSSLAKQDYLKFIYHGEYKFDGELWTVSELHRETPRWLTYVDAIVNSDGDRIVSNRPGPVGILSTANGFTCTTDIPHDPLGYGYPFRFQGHPYVCLVFEIHDGKSYGTELWVWKEHAIFEPIKTSFQWINVGNMIRVQDDLFYVVGNRRRTTENVNSDNQTPGNQSEAGIFLMNVKRVDGVLRGEVELIEEWTSREYSERFSEEYFCIGKTLFQQERHFDFKESVSSPTTLRRLDQGKFVPADDFQAVPGATLTVRSMPNGDACRDCYHHHHHHHHSDENETEIDAGRRTFGIASLTDESNSMQPCGFFELEAESGVWRDRTLETGFFHVAKRWKPASDSAWTAIEGVSNEVFE